MKKRTKIIIATICVAGYNGVRKCTNTINWKVFLIDEKNPEQLIENERQKILEIFKEAALTAVPSTEHIRAEVKKQEVHFVDTFLCSDPRGIGKKSKVGLTLKQQ